jgi:hypothetical protein
VDLHHWQDGNGNNNNNSVKDINYFQYKLEQR